MPEKHGSSPEDQPTPHVTCTAGSLPGWLHACLILAETTLIMNQGYASQKRWKNVGR